MRTHRTAADILRIPTVRVFVCVCVQNDLCAALTLYWCTYSSPAWQIRFCYASVSVDSSEFFIYFFLFFPLLSAFDGIPCVCGIGFSNEFSFCSLSRWKFFEIKMNSNERRWNTRRRGRELKLWSTHSDNSQSLFSSFNRNIRRNKEEKKKIMNIFNHNMFIWILHKLLLPFSALYGLSSFFWRKVIYICCLDILVWKIVNVFLERFFSKLHMNNSDEKGIR